MSDPFRTEENRLPEPHRDFAGNNNTDGVGKRAFKAIAKLWQPRGTTGEEAAATVSRYAQRLIDRLTGKAYSADELAPRVDLATPTAGGGIVVINGVSEVVVWNADQGKYQILRAAGGASAEYLTFSDIP